MYTLGPGETVVGNALDGQPGVDLKDQEGDSPRRMAGRHAALVSTGGELVIRDLESPGGTFVNRQRLLAGQARRLEPGDLIQLASVQLAVKRGRGAARGFAAHGGRAIPGSPARPAAPPLSAGASTSAAVAGAKRHGRDRWRPAGSRFRSRFPAARFAGAGTISWCWQPSTGMRCATS